MFGVGKSILNGWTAGLPYFVAATLAAAVIVRGIKTSKTLA
jgi:hypothetical protein